MSLTSVIEARTTKTSVPLTPTKRKRSTPEPRTAAALPTTAEIYSWVFTSEAIASCFIVDIRVMKRHKHKEEEFWWLKRIPCRTVKIVGMVVGVQPYEKRILYLVDDGTSVIECVHKCGTPPPPSSPTKNKSFLNDSGFAKPVAWVGNTVEIVGRIIEFETKESEKTKGPQEPRRQLQVQTIVQCKSVNEKLYHWRTVLELHKNNYSLHEPFIIPSPPTSSVSTPLKRTEVTTPSTVSSTVSSASSASTASTASSSTYSSPVRQEQSPVKLRHPSRLHTASLTKQNFRIYVKHYMDNPPFLDDSDSESDFTDVDDDDDFAGPTTPTKRPNISEMTPRRSTGLDETPRPKRPLASLNLSVRSNPTISTTRRGFTLSYLRRVPELSYLAYRVAKAEGKREDREARKKMKEAAKSQNRSQAPKPTSSLNDSISTRIKALWDWVLVQLIQEGNIVLWDGPTYPITPDTFSCSINSRLWKLNSSSITDSSTITTNSDMSIFSSASSDREEESHYVDLPDPKPGEEAYIAVSTDLVSDAVEEVIRNWAISRPSPETMKFTKHGILRILQRNSQWDKLGEWHVEDALQLLKSKGRVNQISRDAWGPSRGLWTGV